MEQEHRTGSVGGGGWFQAIAAMSLNRVIGQGGRIPWHLPDDFRWFKQLTTGHILVMGRRTFESIGKALPHRTTLVLSRSGFWHPDVRTITSLREIDPACEERKVFLCGGAEVYRLGLPACSDLYLTLVKRLVDGDVFFPAFEERFECVETIREQEEFRILHYRNRRPEAAWR